MKITGGIYCTGLLEGSNINVEYLVNQFSNDVVWATASAWGPSSESNDTRFYSPTQNGWTTAPVIITYDSYGAANYGFFTVSLNRTTLVVTVVYTDSDLPAPGTRTYTMTPDKCIVNTF